MERFFYMIDALFLAFKIIFKYFLANDVTIPCIKTMLSQKIDQNNTLMKKQRINNNTTHLN